MTPTDIVTAAAASLEQSLSDTYESSNVAGRFANESARTLRIAVDGGVWLKPGAAIAYRGELVFERRPTLESHSIADALIRETAPLVRAVGKGCLYCAQHGAHVRVIHLGGESLAVAAENLLAFEDTLAFEARLAGNGIGLAAGGLVTMRLAGHGALAIATHGQPLTLRVSRDQPVSTDPHATLAWSAGLTPLMKTDLTWRSLFAHGGHEPIQMLFEGSGFVVVQPFEDPSRFHIGGNQVKRLAALLTPGA
jgi:uncharacterized protein (AIM24 family)